MKKLNCWEVKKCGRQSGVHASGGECPVIQETRLHGVHGGMRAGRACWVIAGTLCGGQEQGTFASKYHNCEKCEFYRQVRQEEGSRYELSILLLKRLENVKTMSR
jgi:hypothetical protein